MTNPSSVGKYPTTAVNCPNDLNTVNWKHLDDFGIIGCVGRSTVGPVGGSDTPFITWRQADPWNPL